MVDKLDLWAFCAPYEGDGRRNVPYSPAMVVKVLIYGYATGVYSSRGIARKLEEELALRMLGAGNFPQHRTICEFRRRHLKDFRKLFCEVVQVSREMGLVRPGTPSIDGTKDRTNASKRKAMSYDRLVQEEARLREEIAGLTATAARVDAEEDARLGKEVRGDELPEELRRREDRLRAIEAPREWLEAAQRRADDERGREPGQDRPAKGPTSGGMASRIRKRFPKRRSVAAATRANASEEIRGTRTTPPFRIATPLRWRTQRT